MSPPHHHHQHIFRKRANGTVTVDFVYMTHRDENQIIFKTWMHSLNTQLIRIVCNAEVMVARRMWRRGYVEYRIFLVCVDLVRNEKKCEQAKKRGDVVIQLKRNNRSLRYLQYQIEQAMAYLGISCIWMWYIFEHIEISYVFNGASNSIYMFEPTRIYW